MTTHVSQKRGVKRIGLLGGIGPEGTVDYYQRIIEATRDPADGINTPEILIYSANLREAYDIVNADDRPALTTWLASKLDTLAAAGADFAAMTANTAHLVFDEVAASTRLPLISIVDATCAEVQRLGLQRGGLMGTGFTMRADFYAKAFARHGIELISPTDADQALIHNKLFTEIELGIYRDETRDALLEIVRQMRERQGIEFMVLGCTELPLILPSHAFAIPLLNTTALHVDAIARACLGD